MSVTNVTCKIGEKEIKFSSPEELVKQINIDISKVKNK